MLTSDGAGAEGGSGVGWSLVVLRRVRLRRVRWMRWVGERRPRGRGRGCKGGRVDEGEGERERESESGMPWVETCGEMLRVSRRANYLGACGMRGVPLAHVLYEAGGALVSRAVFRVLLGRL